MIAGREGRNLRFQRFALGGFIFLSTAEWLGFRTAKIACGCLLLLTLVIELWQERKAHRD